MSICCFVVRVDTMSYCFVQREDAMVCPYAVLYNARIQRYVHKTPYVVLERVDTMVCPYVVL